MHDTINLGVGGFPTMTMRLAHMSGSKQTELTVLKDLKQSISIKEQLAEGMRLLPRRKLAGSCVEGSQALDGAAGGDGGPRILALACRGPAGLGYKACLCQQMHESVGGGLHVHLWNLQEKTNIGQQQTFSHRIKRRNHKVYQSAVQPYQHRHCLIALTMTLAAEMSGTMSSACR